MTGKVTTYERFEVCAGERCMAYRAAAKSKYIPERPEYLRLTNHT